MRIIPGLAAPTSGRALVVTGLDAAAIGDLAAARPTRCCPRSSAWSTR